MQFYMKDFGLFLKVEKKVGDGQYILLNIFYNFFFQNCHVEITNAALNAAGNSISEECRNRIKEIQDKEYKEEI